MFDFFSDNTSSMAPEMLQSIIDANEGSLPSYAADRYTTEAHEVFSELFGREVAVFFVSTGTAANALSVASVCPPWKRVLCHSNSHLMESEAGAPEAAGGGMKLSAPRDRALKLSDHQVRNESIRYKTNDPHTARYGLVSVSQATELGTVYTIDELTALSAVAKRYDLRLHMDGARFSNAAVSLNCEAAEMSWKLGFDALSLGIAKNGGGLGDAIVRLDLAKAEELRFRQMRAGHLTAKHRFMAAQAVTYVRNGLWRRLAVQANEASQALARSFETRGWQLLSPVDANIVFVALPEAQVRKLIESGYPVSPIPPSKFGLEDRDVGNPIIRFLTSWNSSAEKMKQLDALLS